ncbi:unnamed protein product [Pylaiella littoralis]
MEQVFFRLHVRFVTTVTRLLSPKTRRVLEYVTLANAFLLVVSLAWLHTRFVNPKGRQGSAVSCLPAALKRAGVDPAQLHVLQIHIRLLPDDRGGDGGDGSSGSDGSGGRRQDPAFSPDGSSGSQSHYSRRGDDRELLPGPYRHTSSGLAGGSGGGGGGSEESGSSGEKAAAAAAAPDSAVGCVSTATDSAAVSGGSGGGGGSALGLESPPASPEIFYSMKLVTGKDAVGTLSGPGTLGIERCAVINPGEGREGGDGVDAGHSGGGGGGGGSGGNGGEAAFCGEAMDDKRLTVVQTLVDAFSWRKGKGKGEGGGGEAAIKAGRGEGPPPREERRRGGFEGHPHQWAGVGGATTSGVCASALGDAAAAAAAAAASSAAAAATSDGFISQELQRQRGGGVASEGGRGGEGEGGIPQQQQKQQQLQDEVYLYSLEKGFLMLRPDLRRKHGIVTANVTVSAQDPCLGGTVVQALVKDFVGYDTVVMNWLISLYGGRGFLYGVHNNELFNLNYAAEFIESTEDLGKFVVFKVGVLFTTLFLFFTTTTLVSFTLRETQERMLKFTFLLQHHVRHRLPYAPLIFTHVVESLVFVPIMVGILFFLFEFFSDQLLAFMVLSVVWLCEVYSVVSVRTSVCIRFFPQVFFLYFTLFHVYFFSFPFGFSYLALVTTVLFLQHSMLFCWNRYEVPALRTGVISAARPRQAGMVIGVVPRYDPHGMGLPLAPLPGVVGVDIGGISGHGGGGGVGVGVGVGVPAGGRQRAATASSLDRPREQSVAPAALVAGRAILRSNSSPDPTSSSPPLGSGSHSVGGSGGGRSSTAAVASAPLDAPPPTSSDPLAVAVAAAEWPLPREWGGGDGDGGGGGTLDGSAAGFPRNNASPPMLGSLPLPSWSVSQVPTAVRHGQTTASATSGAMGPRIAATDSESVRRPDREGTKSGGSLAGPSGSSSKSSSSSGEIERESGVVRDDHGGVSDGEGRAMAVVKSAAIVSSASRRRREQEGEGRGNGNALPGIGAASATFVRGEVVPATAATTMVFDGDDARRPSDVRIVGDVRGSGGSGIQSSPAATTKPLEENIGNVATSASAPASEAAAAAAAAAADDDARSALVAGRDCRFSSTPEDSAAAAAAAVADDDTDNIDDDDAPPSNGWR